MKRARLSIIFFILTSSSIGFAQNVLPDITVRSINGRVIVSWLNDYAKPLENIIIQRSFDSLGNFKSIGSVLNPQNKENGYPDQNPPYDKMYYRVFIYFENGEYISGPAFKAISEKNKFNPIDYVNLPEPVEVPVAIPEIKPEATPVVIPDVKISISDSNQIKEEPDPLLTARKISKIEIKKDNPIRKMGIIDSVKTIQIKKTTEYSFPSTRIFNNKMNNLTIQLPDYSTKKYLIRFFDDNNTLLFEVKKIIDDYLILEKSNFIHSGWFYFEIFEDGLLIEKNKFYIGKELKTAK